MYQSAKKCVTILENKLAKFNISLEEIVTITT